MVVATCFLPNAFSLVSSDPYEAMWRVSGLCALVLGAEALTLFRSRRHPRLAGATLIAACAALALAAVAWLRGGVDLALACSSIDMTDTEAFRRAAMGVRVFLIEETASLTICASTLVLLVLGWHRTSRLRPASN